MLHPVLYIPIFDAFEDASSLLDGIHLVGFSALCLDDLAERALPKRFERDEPLVKQVLILIEDRCGCRLPMVDTLDRLEMGKRLPGRSGRCVHMLKRGRFQGRFLTGSRFWSKQRGIM